MISWLDMSTRISEFIKSQTKTFFSRKISRRLILTNLFLSLIPLIVMSIILYVINNTTIKQYIYQRNFETAKRGANEINLFLETPRRILITLASSPDVANMERFTQNYIINKIKFDYPIFQNLYILSNDGQVLATTSFEKIKGNFTQLPVFKAAIQGKEYFSGVYFVQNQTPILYISEPIYRFNKVVAVIIGEVDIKRIWDLIDDITLGQTGKAFLFAADGTLIAHPNKQLVINQQKISHYGFYDEILKGRSGITTYKDENSQSYLAAYIPVPDFSWGLVLQQSEKEAFKLASDMIVQITFILFSTFLLSIIFSLLLVRRFTRPIVNLLQGAREFTAGNLSYQIQQESNDEISLLANEFNEMAKSLQRHQQQLQKMERIATMSRFASMVSHEVRNPLNSMGINMQMILRLINKDPIPRTKIEYYTSIISSEIERIDDLINNFLIIARPPTPNFIKIEIHEFLKNIISLHLEQAGQKKIEIFSKFHPAPLFGEFDEHQLKQVFINLIVNAFDAMPDGGTLSIITHAFIRSTSGREEHFCQIEVRDTGEGIDDEYMKDIFDMYFTTKKTGTGMGLAIVKQIVDSHNGNIYIHSQKSVGTSVYIELPIEKF